jgi:DHA1 family bicyclomycin/chloramphenicol resistance-like MFS transporter
LDPALKIFQLSLKKPHMLLFFTILLIEILSGIEVDIFIPSFPELQRIFHLSPFLVQFMLSANLVAYCICSIFAGALGDRYNRRHVMLISLCLFFMGSILCVSAHTYPMLLMGRVLQGIGMAGPAVLAYPIISDHYPIEKQAAMMGILNGAITLAMAFAPVIGSYINFYFHWQGNFFILLLCSIICLVMGYFFIPHHTGDKTVSLSPTTYGPLLRSAKFNTFLAAVCFLIVPFWVFIGMAPILYMGNLGVTLKAFGYYQGAISAVFSIICFLSPFMLSRFGKKQCLYAGMALSLFSVLCMLVLIFLHHPHAWLITAVAMCMAAGAVFPVNILFPLSLTVLENSKSRATALLMAMRLLFTAVVLSIVSYFYTGTFTVIALSMIILLVLSVFFMMQLLAKKWVSLE